MTLNRDTLIRTIKFGAHRYENAVAAFERAVEQEGPMKAMRRTGHSAIEAQAALDAQKEALEALDGHADNLHEGVRCIVAYAADVAGRWSIKSDVLEAAYDAAYQRAFAQISASLIQWLEA